LIGDGKLLDAQGEKFGEAGGTKKQKVETSRKPGQKAAAGRRGTKTAVQVETPGPWEEQLLKNAD